MRLHELAHSRTGDKGTISDISVVAYQPGDYEFLRQHVTAGRVREHFADIVHGHVERYELPQLSALKFVLHDALGGGVTRTLNLDIHGKSLGSSLLEMELPGRTET
ncbi:MAG: hypothetical protein JWQ81_6599 [Amycolatopsis sp.]|jgi:hypothetical protein|uniref:AtuA-related protein n=1 Tax=Amycolatopsis sp. TaxID=37632 RepID=UPI00262E2A1F|nr:hypothetical protein [Amycolatopsis sp.]MCU1685860.1 hypothetical protein [Amycolatopsis sp.]